MSMYKQFATDPEVEKSGVVLDYGEFRITVARAGGANKRYQKVLERLSRPIQRALTTGLVDNDRAMDILKQAHAEAVVKNWELKQGEEWVQGIEGPNGDILPFNRENVLLTFRQIDDLFQDVREQASSSALYRAGLEEELGKSSLSA